MTNTTQRYDTAGQIIAYENGELNLEDTIELFDHLVRTGMICHLQGSYQRTALDLHNQGYL